MLHKGIAGLALTPQGMRILNHGVGGIGGGEQISLSDASQNPPLVGCKQILVRPELPLE